MQGRRRVKQSLGRPAFFLAPCTPLSPRCPLCKASECHPSPLACRLQCDFSDLYSLCVHTHTHTQTHPPPYSLHHNHICLCKTHRALSSAIPCRIKPADFSLPSWSLVWSNPPLLSSWFLANPHLPCPTPSRPFPFQALTKPYDLQHRLQTASRGI